jgi:hypothetical protein
MKYFLTVALIFFWFNIFGQNRCAIKLIDSYSLEQINLDHSFITNKKHYSIDSINNLIIIEKPFGRLLTISSDPYEMFQEKIDFKKHSSDTIKIQLKPNKTLVRKVYNEIWNADNQLIDTVEFNNSRSLERRILSYLNYLSVIDEMCDNGMCNYSNTYRYQINFVKSESVYMIEKIVKLQPWDYNCEELDKHLKLLQSIFPKFILKEEAENFSLQFTIMI